MSAHDGDATVTTTHEAVPKDWLPGLTENWRSDVVAGFILFLLALPLSLGIAIASGAPPIAGVITAIVGGLLVGFMSGSYVTINGPAAGLIVIVLGAIEGLGEGDLEAGFRYALAVGVVCGAIQIVLGFLRAGAMTNFFPLSVVHGMLAGIGVIIMARQLPVAVGVQDVAHIIPDEWPVLHGSNSILALPDALSRASLNPTIIGLASILIMIFWPKLKPIGKYVPAPLVAAVVGVALGVAFSIDADRLITLPEGGLFGGVTTPDFGKILTGESIRWIVAFVFVASLESLLTASAVDKLDPYKRRSNMNREFLGKGVGNMVSSFLGGLPMIAEVVRSSANIFNGAKTRWSNFFHGAFMLLFVGLVPGVLEMIPLAALAGILVVVGFRLAHPSQFVHALHIGKEELLFMVVTLIVVVAEDLLVGVIFGVIVGLVTALVRGTAFGNLFRARMEVEADSSSGTAVVKFRKALGFGNFVGIRAKLDKIPAAQAVILDFSEANFVDHTVVERLDDWEAEYTREGGRVERRGLEHLHHATHEPMSALVQQA
ncbi:MAG: SulP family inorganic anion transporter [Chloroflexia bacterium]|nr:SulP family inorganic anion transporter [Chloroflexia bacterium]